MISLVAAGKADLPLIKNMAIQSWNQAYATILSSEQLSYMLEKIYAVSSLEEQMEVLNQKFFLLTDDTTSLGFAAFTQVCQSEKEVKLNKFYLLPDYKGKGFGKIFMKLILEKVKTEGAKRITLNVNRNNPALQFYEHIGFRILAEEDIAIGPFWMNDFVMEKHF